MLDNLQSHKKQIFVNFNNNTRLSINNILYVIYALHTLN